MNAREQIMKAADDLFGQQGFDAASVREIAELSGVNKALIHYYFASKEGLFESVLDSYFERLNEILLGILQEDLGVREKMERVLDLYVDFLAANRNFSLIVQREASGGKHMDRIFTHLLPVFKQGMELIHTGYPGTVSGDLAAGQLLISFYGMIVTYFSYSQLLERLLNVDPLDDKSLAARKRHLHRMLDLVVDSFGQEVGNAKPNRAKKGPQRSRP